MKIINIVGTRPNYMKIAPIINRIDEYNNRVSPKGNPKTKIGGNHITHVLVHTGQHYDINMSDSFFKDLGLPDPDFFLGVGSASHAAQTAEIMKLFEGVLLAEMPDFVIVPGDVNSTLACALAASKITYSGKRLFTRPLIAHVESGLRSFDRSMPEEINRKLTDSISDLLFVTEESAIRNLQNENIEKNKIFFVGNTMIDTLLLFKEKAKYSPILDKIGMKNQAHAQVSGSDDTSIFPYVLVTLHRPSNVDDAETLKGIITSLEEISKQITVVFPAHPRTKENIHKFNLDSFMYYVNDGEIRENRINVLEPLSYIDFLSLIMHARIVLTDSGGIQEETTCLHIPCITVRNNTERPITVTDGTNMIAGVKKSNIIKVFLEQLKRQYKNKKPKYWDGKASDRILKVLLNSYQGES